MTRKLILFALLFAVCLPAFGQEIQGPAAAPAGRQTVYAVDVDQDVIWRAYGGGVDLYSSVKDTQSVCVTPFRGKEFILVASTVVDGKPFVAEFPVSILGQTVDPDDEEDGKDDEVIPKPDPVIDPIIKATIDAKSLVEQTSRFPEETAAIKKSLETTLTWAKGRPAATPSQIRSTLRNATAIGLRGVSSASVNRWSEWDKAIAKSIELTGKDTREATIESFEKVLEGVKNYDK